ncbi:exopolysaccharide production protein ExoF [Bosea lathyri]|uniref:Exopolysaccharide production protein ExoF n=1 Tax=Bosea lathyri TaxID=1036778 RepID=A0A1H5YSY6_9HYPH|nr:exopolysaccharide production protein ExoF [Bosea lathyri]
MVADDCPTASTGSRLNVGSLSSKVSSALLALALLTALTLPSFADEADYKLGPLDKIKVKVSEWRPTSGDVFEWAGLTGEFTINSVGMLSLPIVGPIHAESATTGEIAAIISERLKSIAGLVKSPNAAVEISQYRPFYVVGNVERPGEYAYRPGMSVIQAVSIAGGFFRPDTNMSRFERETIVTEGDIRINETQRAALLLRRDRLLSETQNLEAIRFSEEVLQHKDERVVAQGMREEGQIFASRLKTARSQTDLLRQAKSLLEEELKTLAAKSVTQQKQYDLVRKELDNINSLLSRGLAVSPRQLAVEQNLAQMESQMLDLLLATARTKQEISRNERNIIELQNLRENEINKDLRETQISLRQTTDRINSLQMLIYDSQVSGPRQQLLQSSEAARLSFRIVRRQDGKLQEIAAEQTDAVRPGDILKIQRPPLATVDAAGAGAAVAGSLVSRAPPVLSD